jgi:hypothetical protein
MLERIDAAQRLAARACQASGQRPNSAAPPQVEGPAALEIAAVVPVTEHHASLGEQVKVDYELAFERLNQTSSLPLKLRLVDDECIATKTVQRIETLYQDHNAPANSEEQTATCMQPPRLSRRKTARRT